MKEFTKDFEFSHDGSAKTEYKAGDKCALTGFALECAKNRDAVKEVADEKKEAPKNENKSLPEGDNKNAVKGKNKQK
jgi:hypothetical protein